MMRAQKRAARYRCWWRLVGLGGLPFLLAIALASPLFGQQAAVETTPNEVRAFELQQPPNRLRRMLAQLDAVLSANPLPVDQAGESEPAAEPFADQLNDALELIDAVLTDPATAESVVEVSPGRFIPLSDLCHLRLASLPPVALAQYRDRVDPVAKKLYEQGVERRDEAALQQVVREMFCSQWGDDALLALAEIALERGDTAAASRYLRRIGPLLSAPGGAPLAWALRGVELPKHSAAVVDQMRAAAPAEGMVVFPDSDIPASTALARLAVASLREGDIDQAAIELAVLRELAPEAKGRIAGREAILAEAIEKMLNASREQEAALLDKPRTVGPLVGRVWPQRVPAPLHTTYRFVTGLFSDRRLVAEDNQAGPPQYEPVAWRDKVLYRDGPRLLALDLTTGKPAITRTGELYSSNSPAEVASPRLRRPQLARRLSPASEISEGVSVEGDQLYARVEAANTEGRRILGIDLVREGLVTLEIEPPEEPWSFAGPPVVVAGRLYVALSADDVRPRVGVASYSAATGRSLWQTSLGSGPPAAGFGLTAKAPLRLVVGGDTVYLNTNLGAVAALDRMDGAIRWITRYQTIPPDTLVEQSVPDEPSGAECVLQDDRLYVAPHESGNILAIDAATGLTLWSRPAPTRDAQLLGVASGILVVGGQQLTGLSAADGALRYQWPDSPKAGLRGMGRGCLAGGEVFWTSRDRLYILDAKTGAQTRPSIDISDLGGAGANVIPAAGGLIVAGSKAMTVLGPVDREEKEDGPKLSSNTPKALNAKAQGRRAAAHPGYAPPSL